MLKTEVQSTALLADVAAHPSASSINLTEIAGYRLQERIGVGGFGEVWRAIGPGGFPKAVKILFGNLSGPQAETELRSLSRIRELRHPFLLSVERVEVIDSRVVIVTELADRSLEDRFREIVASGHKGIPRDELIGYLRDAADALDFMAEQHELQHLDVKPDNLLLQGTHAKVGDFGLTKSLSAAGHSLVNGFTPLYAPPELFDGRPERGSDQYSLAIVYQMMLTGVPPFNGRSAAQLTSQHLKMAPDLSSLHPSDRSVVARALSKNPRTRFPSCRQFIDELSRRRFSNSSLPRVTEPAVPVPLSPLTEFVEAGTAGLSRSQLLPPATPLRPPGTQGLEWTVRPTMFVAIGGMGMEIISHLRDRLQKQYPDLTVPALHFLCIDADIETLRAAEAVQPSSSGTTLATVSIPLKTSHEYRKTPGDHLNWLSRRWLFNIPRSGNVEGMRPLGRLAFIDHQEQIRAKFQKGIDQIFHADAAQASKDQTQLPFTRDGLDFVIVGSISGGTCSGSLLDTAALLRAVLADRRLPPCNVTAIMLHGTGTSGQLADMQDANTISFLQELNHFSLPGVQSAFLRNRSGDSDSPSMPMDDAVFVHLGDDLSHVEFQSGLSRVSDYLALRTITPARLEMDSWRIAEDSVNESPSSFQLRTFGLANVNCETWEVANAESKLLAAQMLQRWVSAKSATDAAASAPVVAGISTLIHDLALNRNAIVELVPRLLNAERTRRVDEYASGIWSRLGPSTATDDVPGLVASLISQENTSSSLKSAIATVIEEIRRDLNAGVAWSLSKITAYLQNAVDGRGRIAIGEFVIQNLLVAIEESIQASALQKSDLQSAFAELCSGYVASNTIGSDGHGLKSFCRQYCMLLVCQTVCQNVTSQLKSLRDAVSKLQEEQLNNLKKQLQLMSSTIGVGTGEKITLPAAMLNAFDDFLLKNGRFKMAQLMQREVRPSDTALLSGEATNFLFQSIGTASPVATAPALTTNAFPGTARPFLRNVGGGQRVLVALPEQLPTEPWKTQVQQEFGACVSVCPMDRKDISVLCEVEGVGVSVVVEILSNLKPKVVELASRVHSRQDIQW